MSKASIPREGLALKEAWYALASPALQQRIVGRDPVFAPPIDRAAKLIDLLQPLTEISQAQTEKNAARQQAFEVLCRRLADGKLTSRGIRMPVVGAPTDEPIARPFWDDARIDPKDFSVTAAGVTYRSVRIFRAARSRQSVEPVAAKKSKGGPIGRPTTTEPIRQAIEALLNSRQDFASSGRKAQCDAVRVHRFGSDVDNSDPPKGWSDSAIKQHLSELCPT
ncbi:MAG: hypothetical protein QM773_05535 [Hyphomonadaceae bacterium]